MKSRRFSFSCVALCAVFTVSSAWAGTFDQVISFAEKGKWGARQLQLTRSFGGNVIFITKHLVAVSSTVAGIQGSINYLFNKNGKLYNLAWYATIPVTEMAAAQELERALEAELRAKYGEPVYTFSDGDESKAAAVVSRGGATYDDMTKMFGGDNGLPKGEDGKLDIDQMMMMMPSIFYSKLVFWDGGKIWVYSNLLCSTDGTCYFHVQFVSKKMTAAEKYRPSPDVAFSYSPLDRDQDMVTDTHKGWLRRRSKE